MSNKDDIERLIKNKTVSHVRIASDWGGVRLYFEDGTWAKISSDTTVKVQYVGS